MSTPQPTPPAPHSPGTPSYLRVRRAPRYAPFAGLGAALGLGVAVAVALIARAGQTPASVTIGGVVRAYSLGQVIAYLGLFGVALGAIVGLLVALGLERSARGRRHR